MIGLGLVIASAATVHCAGLASHGDCLDYNTCEGIHGEGGADGDGGGDGGPILPPTCDITKDVKDSPDCVDDGVGIFVSPTGKPGAAGSKADPLRDISEAVSKAATRNLPRVYVCEGTYDKAVAISQGVSIFGGLSCAWAVKPEARPKLAPSTGIALKIASVAVPVVVADLEIVGSSDETKPGDSAIAVFVSQSKDVTFRRTTITAGPGRTGAKGATASNYTGATATKGNNANAGNGGAELTCACLDGKTSSKGGRGGTVGGAAIFPSSGGATPAVGASNSGTSGSDTCTPGKVGADGVASTGGNASPRAGTLASSGWDAAQLGTAGDSGNPGQGGGGGGGINDSSQGGSGGGCGGCGGAGGAPGANGGSSFALLSFESTVVISASTLTTAAAGAGGAGGPGQDGQAGGGTGLGACQGGTGGIGAGGSGGGGGAGGHSVTVAFVGTEPRLENTTATPGAKGARGLGGAGGQGGGNAGAEGSPGPEGQSAERLALQ